MTAAQMLAYFDLLTDKVGTAYFLDAEKYSFLNNASIEYVKRTLPSSEGGVVNIEQDHPTFNNLHTLVYETAGLTPSAGVITKSAVQTALNTASSGTDPLMYIMNVSWTVAGSTYPVRYTRHNDWYEFLQNSFKRGTTSSPRYKQEAARFVFYPVDNTAIVKFTLLKTPRTISSGTDSDLPEHTHKAIVELAVELAAIAIREEALANLNKLQQ